MKAHKLNEDEMNHFDTLRYTKKAVQVGFTQEQAEFQAEEMSKIIDENLATKEDVKLIRHDIQCFRLELKSMENKTMVKMAGMLIATIGILVTLIKLT